MFNVAAIVTLIVLWLGSLPCRAQEQVPLARVPSPREVATQAERAPLATPAARVDEQPAFGTDELRRAYRGRWLLATGGGLLAGAVIGAAVGSRRRRCEYRPGWVDRTSSRTTAGVFGSAGLALLTAGAVRLASAPSGVSVTRARIAGMTATSVGLAAASFLAVSLASLSEIMPCWGD
jgi:hypothetical protein